MAGWCTEAQLSLQVNAYEVTDWSDDAGDGTADTGVKAFAISSTAGWMWSIIAPQYKDVTAMDPATYTAGSEVYPVLEGHNALFANDWLRARQGKRPIDKDHPTLVWCRQVAQGLAEIE